MVSNHLRGLRVISPTGNICIYVCRAFCSIYTSVHTPAELGRVLNEELKLTEEWVAGNKLVLIWKRQNVLGVTWFKTFIESHTSPALHYR